MTEHATPGVEDGTLRRLAREVLDAFEAISGAARGALGRRGVDLESFAVVNSSTAESVVKEFGTINDERLDTAQRLSREPAVARLVIVDEDDREETIYVTAGGTVTQQVVQLCSYLSPKGRLAALNIGDPVPPIRLPGAGVRHYEIVDKATFMPVEDRMGWDAQPAVRYRAKLAPETIRSLREELRLGGVAPAAVDAVEAWLRGGEANDNVLDGLRRDALTAMQLRVAPILNAFQDRIFRLPIDRQIAVLGAPGTGKTTTLVKRLRQKIDANYLDPEDERPRVAQPDDAGLPHGESWLLFTPTELLRLYIQSALAREGVAAPDERVRTWSDFRRELGVRHLRILRTGTRSGLIPRDHDDLLSTEALGDQIGWFEAFDAHQQAEFVRSLAIEADRLAAADDPVALALGRAVVNAIARADGRLLQLLGELAGLADRLRDIAAGRRDDIRAELRAPLSTLAQDRQAILGELTRFVELLGDEREEVDEEGEEDAEAEEDEAPDRAAALRGARLAEDMFVRAMRSRAVAQASGRSLTPGSRAARLLGWLVERGFDAPDLRATGMEILVRRAAGRLARAPSDYLVRIPLRYRRFRRAMREEGRWYGDVRGGALDAHPAEIDLIVLAMLRASLAMERDRLLSQRLADRQPAILQEIARLRRHQVLVDEATDFSPVQLACMRALAHPRTESLFLSGDFNQRLTRWGSRSEAQLRWVSPAIEIERIDVSYRQTRKLADFAGELGRLSDYEIVARPPDFLDNVGFDPVVGCSLATISEQAAWLSARIREVERITDGVMPTVAVLVCDADALEPLAVALSVELADISLRAVACPKGMVKGQPGDVRVFEVEYIKGLEFEAVFFIDIDVLKRREPVLFDRYLYVGATRAATFLGLTSRDAQLPGRLPELAPLLRADWRG